MNWFLWLAGIGAYGWVIRRHDIDWKGVGALAVAGSLVSVAVS